LSFRCLWSQRCVNSRARIALLFFFLYISQYGALRLCYIPR
jgi:hypothetical protein